MEIQRKMISLICQLKKYIHRINFAPVFEEGTQRGDERKI